MRRRAMPTPAKSPRNTTDGLDPTIRLRSVRGRIDDPYRGGLALEQPERFEPRAGEPQPIAAVAAKLGELPDAKRVTRGRRIMLSRRGQAVHIVFASATRPEPLDALRFEGDPELAIEALHALLPAFGPVELRTGRFVDLIDGHEPAARVVERYQAFWPRLAPRPPGRPHRVLLAACALVVAVVAGSLWFLSRTNSRMPSAACSTCDASSPPTSIGEP